MPAGTAELREAEDEPGGHDEPGRGPVAAGGGTVDVRGREPEKAPAPAAPSSVGGHG